MGLCAHIDMYHTAKITAWIVFFIAILPLMFFAVSFFALCSMMTIFASLYDGAEKIKRHNDLCRKNIPAKSVEIIQ